MLADSPFVRNFEVAGFVNDPIHGKKAARKARNRQRPEKRGCGYSIILLAESFRESDEPYDCATLELEAVMTVAGIGLRLKMRSHRTVANGLKAK